MSTPPTTLLLIELAKHIASTASLIFSPQLGQTANLYIHMLPDNAPGGSVESVIRFTGGEAKRWDPLDRAFIQIMTRAPDQGEALGRAYAIYQALLDAEGRPLRRLSLGAQWLALELDVDYPQTIGLDEKKRHLFVSTLTMNAASIAA